MINMCRQDKEGVTAKLKAGKLDYAKLSTSNLVDDIILDAYNRGILDCVSAGIKDHRRANSVVPYSIIWAAAIAAKMRQNTCVSDIPYALTDHKVLGALGYNLIDTDDGLKVGLMRESTLRHFLGKYTVADMIDGYNCATQNHIMQSLGICPNIHILDCTDLEVDFYNTNYEGATIGYSKRKHPSGYNRARGYKLATLRGLVDDVGIIEDIRFGSLNINDLPLSMDMLKKSPVLHEGDCVIYDRGFLSRELLNHLKLVRGVDSYVPLRHDMLAYKFAVQLAKESNYWTPHPMPNYANQYITLVTDLGDMWQSDLASTIDVPINGCVVWDQEDDSYQVFITTDIHRSAKDILLTYKLRTEVEEDYRQLKDFWSIEDFRSTQINVIAFHLVSTLFGYLFFQLFTLNNPEYAHRSLPVVLKNYNTQVQGYIVLYVDDIFGVFSLVEVMRLYTVVTPLVRVLIENCIESDGANEK